MLMISITLITDGVPCPRNAPAGFSVAVCKILARSSSEYRPSEPRFSLKGEKGLRYYPFQMGYFWNLPSKGPL